MLQADVTRCGGVTGFLAVGALCEAHHIDLSGHCAPALHRHVACAAPRLRHLEWFHDHVRIEHMLFDGAPTPCDGAIAPDLSRPGHGLDFKAEDAERFRIARSAVKTFRRGAGSDAGRRRRRRRELAAERWNRLFRRRGPPPTRRKRRRARLHRGAGVLALSVLADSALEHYRGSFHNKAMYRAARQRRR